MNSFIEFLNQRGGIFLEFAWPMLWQSSLLITVLFGFDAVFRRKLRASIRYALWLVVMLKLCVPPTLALPTSPAWWLHKTPPPAVARPLPHYTVTFDKEPLPEAPPMLLPAVVPPKPVMIPAAGLLATSASVSLTLLVWLLVRWWQVARQVRRAKTSERLNTLAGEAQKIIGTKCNVQVRLTTNSMSPAVCGLFRPAILIPQSLAEKFSDEQLRAVLLHELIHLRRRDVCVNFAQALLQIAYWWHPLVWLANARIRRVREEAVDDAVMMALRDEAESYAPTLLEVAKLALNRPLASLGLVGIMESRHALRQRIERLVDFRPPRKAGLTLASLLGIAAFTAVAVPMGQAPVAAINDTGPQSLTVKVDPEIFLRNVKAQAGNYLRATNDDWVPILTDILRGEGVDGVPPHTFDFNINSGEMTAKNSPDALEIFREIIEQLNRPDGNGIIFLPDSSYHRSFHHESVLINARYYEMSIAEYKQAIGMLDNVGYVPGNSGTGLIPANQFAEFSKKLDSLGLRPFNKPRVETGHGTAASLFCGTATNGVHFDCLPYIVAKKVDLAFHASVDGDFSADGTTLVGTANHQILGRATVENHGGIIVCANNPDGSVKNNLVVVMEVQIVTNFPSVNAGATNVTVALSDPNFRKAIHALEQRTGTNLLPEPVVMTTSGHEVNRIWTDNILSPLDQTNGSQLVQDAKLDYEMGKLNEAERLLNSALRLDAENAAARYYLGLVAAAWQRQNVIKPSDGR
jgi:beta-lactamase regulating signal transducer with metallopeptidase domain